MESQKNTKAWDLWILKDRSSWVGFRVPFKRLQKSVTYFMALLLWAVLMSGAWVFLRFEVFSLREKLTQSELRSRSLELRLSQKSEGTTASTSENSSGTGLEAAVSESSLIPSLGAAKFNLGPLKVEKFTGDLDLARKELSVKFEVTQNPNFKVQSSEAYFWVSVLHGISGLQVFPPALGSQSGEALLSHRGESLKVSSRARNLLARFPVFLQFREMDSAPLYLSLFIYDAKGSLVYRERTSLNVQGKMTDLDSVKSEESR